MTILNEYIYYYNDYHFGVSWWSFLGVGLLVVMALIMIFYEPDNNSAGFIVFFLSCLLIIGIGLIFIRKDKIPVTRYEVTITDENFSFNEFNNKYKLIEERGDILVIEEKNDEKS